MSALAPGWETVAWYERYCLSRQRTTGHIIISSMLPNERYCYSVVWVGKSMGEGKSCAGGSFRAPPQLRNRIKTFPTARFRALAGCVLLQVHRPCAGFFVVDRYPSATQGGVTCPNSLENLAHHLSLQPAYYQKRCAISQALKASAMSRLYARLAKRSTLCEFQRFTCCSHPGPTYSSSRARSLISVYLVRTGKR